MSYHRLEAHSQDAIDEAYYQALTGGFGQIVMDDLYRLVCFSHLPGERELGQHDLWLYILQRLAAYEARMRTDDGPSG